MESERAPAQRPESLARRAGLSLLRIVTLLGLVSAAASPLAGLHWFFELFRHWMPSAALALFVLGIVHLARGRRFLATACALAAASGGVLVIPLLWSGPVVGGDPTGSPVIVVVSANLAMSREGIDGVQRWIREIDPDLICLQELTAEAAWSLRAIVESHPGWHAIPRPDPGGIGIASRWPLARVEVFEDPLGLPQIAAEVDAPFGRITFLGIHVMPPIGDVNQHANAVALAAITERAKHGDRIVVAGDFNLTPWCPTFGRFIEESRLDQARRGFGVANTWPTTPFLSVFGIPIDHVLMRGFEALSFETGPDIRSDHIPVVTRLRLIP